MPIVELLGGPEAGIIDLPASADFDQVPLFLVLEKYPNLIAQYEPCGWCQYRLVRTMGMDEEVEPQ